ncbi:hypothetical protein BD769DRAFT_1644551 [Suillus cothurnatus]|nr:hypothetical protein BD769DRAFT_1644551 [Suillus cothurnatus]
MTSTNPPAGRTTRTRDQIIAENAAITARNDVRVARRNKGESNVENDEPLIPVPPTPPVIFPNSNTANTIATSSTSTVPTTASTQPTAPPPTSNPTGTNVNAMISALANLSPTKIAKIHASIFNTTSSSSSTATASASSIITSPSPLITVPSAPSVTVSSSSNTPTLLFDINNEQPSTLKFVTHYTSHRNSAPTKCHILDVSQFPAESSISIGEWHEAWARFLKLLADYASPEIHDRWARHHKDLREHPDFEDHWPAILAFDMAQRASYTADPQPLDEAKYHRQFESIKTRVLREACLKELHAVGFDATLESYQQTTHLSHLP